MLREIQMCFRDFKTGAVISHGWVDGGHLRRGMSVLLCHGNLNPCSRSFPQQQNCIWSNYNLLRCKLQCLLRLVTEILSDVFTEVIEIWGGSDGLTMVFQVLRMLRWNPPQELVPGWPCDKKIGSQVVMLIFVWSWKRMSPEFKVPPRLPPMPRPPPPPSGW